MSDKPDFYEILGVAKDSDAATIKKAYRKLALEYHPDRNQGDAKAEAMFKAVSEAHEVLSDAEKRAQYDRDGHAGLGRRPLSADDILSDLAKDLHTKTDFSTPVKGLDIETNLEIPFMEAVRGGMWDLKGIRMVPCVECSRSGEAPWSKRVTCRSCDGTGSVTERKLFTETTYPCPTCQSRGRVAEDFCVECLGMGRRLETVDLTLTVPAGVDTGSRLRLKGQGNCGDEGSEPGDLYVTIKVQDHETFKRNGLDVSCKVFISYAQACLGADVKVPTLDGEGVLTIPRGTPSGKVFTMKGRGITGVNGRGQGDQVVQVVVRVPTTLSHEEEELVKGLAAFDPS